MLSGEARQLRRAIHAIRMGDLGSLRHEYRPGMPWDDLLSAAIRMQNPDAVACLIELGMNPTIATTEIIRDVWRRSERRSELGLPRTAKEAIGPWSSFVTADDASSGSDGPPCPCCGFVLGEDEYGTFGICPLCDWEDCGVQLANPLCTVGPNRVCLAEAQIEAIKQLPLDLPSCGVFRRNSDWRPLTNEECAFLKTCGNHDGRTRFAGVVDPRDAYWNRPIQEAERRVRPNQDQSPGGAS